MAGQWLDFDAAAVLVHNLLGAAVLVREHPAADHLVGLPLGPWIDAGDRHHLHQLEDLVPSIRVEAELQLLRRVVVWKGFANRSQKVQVEKQLV